jgi:hypothetical protein
MFAPEPIRPLVGLAALVLLTGCAGSPTPTLAPATPPAADVSPTPTPTVDPAAAFLAAINDPEFSATATLSGAVEIGDLEMEVNGEMRLSGQDAYTLMKASLPDGTIQSTESISVSGGRYVRQGDGLWMLQPAAGENTGSVMPGFDFESLREAGTKVVDGQSLVRLLPVGGSDLAPTFFGLADPSVVDFDAELEFFAEPDGTPAVLLATASWEQALRGTPVGAALELRFDFDRIGQWVRIDEPPLVWTTHTSPELGYAMAIPTEWSADHVAATDEYLAYDLLLGPVDGEVHVTKYPDVEAGLPPNAWFQESASWIEQSFGVSLTTWESITVHELPGALFKAHISIEGRELFYQQVTVLGDGVGWDIDWYSRVGAEESDRKMFLDFVSTFEPQP